MVEDDQSIIVVFTCWHVRAIHEVSSSKPNLNKSVYPFKSRLQGLSDSIEGEFAKASETPEQVGFELGLSTDRGCPKQSSYSTRRVSSVPAVAAKLSCSAEVRVLRLKISEL